MTDSRSELMALADDCDHLIGGNVAVGHYWSVLKKCSSALRLAASQPDREALKNVLRSKRDELIERGIQDMTEDAVTSEFADAILLLSGEVVQKSDGSVETDTPSNETATDVMAHPSPMGSRSCDEKTIACGVAGVAPGPSDYSITQALKSACERLQEFLDTFGDIKDYVTQVGIDDWSAPSDPAPGPDVREALNEVITNGEWTEGEQCGEWKISKVVYDLAVEARDAALSRPVGDVVQEETQTTKPTSSRTEASASETAGGVAINQHLTDVMTWLREPDWTEDASIEWLMGWVNRRPIAAVGMVAMLMPTPPVAETDSRDSSGCSPREVFSDPNPAPPAGGR